MVVIVICGASLALSHRRYSIQLEYQHILYSISAFFLLLVRTSSYNWKTTELSARSLVLTHSGRLAGVFWPVNKISSKKKTTEKKLSRASFGECGMGELEKILSHTLNYNSPGKKKKCYGKERQHWASKGEGTKFFWHSPISSPPPSSSSSLLRVPGMETELKWVWDEGGEENGESNLLCLQIVCFIQLFASFPFVPIFISDSLFYLYSLILAYNDPTLKILFSAFFFLL